MIEIACAAPLSAKSIAIFSQGNRFEIFTSKLTRQTKTLKIFMEKYMCFTGAKQEHFPEITTLETLRS